MRYAWLLAILLLSPGAAAQESASYRLAEHVFNAGGHPEGGVILTSTGFRMTLDALGESVVGSGLESASYRMDGSFCSAYPPPGEVLGLRFTDRETLVWEAERSVGTYNLYRDLLSALSGLGYGTCREDAIAGETASDPDEPAADAGYFYLVTAENRIFEEGTKGRDSGGTERPNPVSCP
jgi:hypothetical protein